MTTTAQPPFLRIPSMEKHPARPLLIALFVLLLVFAAVTLYNCASVLFVIGPNTTGEAGKVYFAKRAMRGETIFPPPLEPPYYPAIHGALLHASVGFLGRLFSVDEQGLYLIGRFISLAATVLAILLGLLMLRQCGVTWQCQLFFAVAMIALISMMHHAVSYRPDNWILFLSALSAWMLTHRRITVVHCLILIVIPVPAFFVKATGVSLLGAIGLTLLMRRGLRFALVYGAASAFLLALCVICLNRLTSGAFLLNLTKGAKMPLSALYPLQILRGNFEIIVALIFPIVALLARVRRSVTDRPVLTVLFSFWFVALVSSVAASMRTGSQRYYFLEPYFYGILIFVYYAARAIQDNERRLPLLIMTGLFLFLAVISARRNLTVGIEDFSLKLSQQIGGERRAVADQVNERGLYCYCDDDGLNVLLDRPAVIYPFVQSQMIRTQSLTPETVTGPVLRRDYDLILLTGKLFIYPGTEQQPTKAFLDALKKEYKRDGDLGPYQRYVRR